MNHVQGRLVPFVPFSGGERHYVVALQNRKGERDALRHLATEARERLTPLIHFVGRATGRDTPNSSTVASWVRAIAEVVDGRPWFLDILRLRPNQRVVMPSGSSIGLLEALYRACRRRSSPFVPVFPVGGDQAHLQVVAQAVALDGRGACLRYQVLSGVLPPGYTRRRLLGETLESLGIDATEAELVLDLGYLDPEGPLTAESLVPVITEVADVGPWRSLIVLGTSIPATMGCITPGTVGTIPRQEWSLWGRLRELGVEPTPVFGDYAIQHPLPPRELGGRGMRANIRYTASSETVVARGFGPVIQEGRDQYLDLCGWIQARPEFRGRSYSWGDEIIADCAAGLIEPGAQSMWRGAGTSHHLQFVTDQLR